MIVIRELYLLIYFFTYLFIFANLTLCPLSEPPTTLYYSLNTPIWLAQIQKEFAVL